MDGVESSGAMIAVQPVTVGSAVERRSTIVARGQLDGARCVDMLIDTGASCCFIRRSCAESMKLKQVPLREPATVTLADKRTTVATHAVKVNSMCVHGSKAACLLLVMEELSNDVIVGLNWQRGDWSHYHTGQATRSAERTAGLQQQASLGGERTADSRR